MRLFVGLERCIGLLVFAVSLAVLTVCMEDLTREESAAFMFIVAVIVAGAFGLYLAMRKSD